MREVLWMQLAGLVAQAIFRHLEDEGKEMLEGEPIVQVIDQIEDLARIFLDSVVKPLDEWIEYPEPDRTCASTPCVLSGNDPGSAVPTKVASTPKLADDCD